MWARVAVLLFPLPLPMGAVFLGSAPAAALSATVLATALIVPSLAAVLATTFFLLMLKVSALSNIH